GQNGRLDSQRRSARAGQRRPVVAARSDRPRDCAAGVARQYRTMGSRDDAGGLHAAPRWRVLFGPLNATRSGFPPIHPDLSTPSGGFSTTNAPVDPDLVRQSIAVLRAYVEQTRLQIEHKPAEPQSGGPARHTRG